jgi:hypothetical protein
MMGDASEKRTWMYNRAFDISKCRKRKNLNNHIHHVVMPVRQQHSPTENTAS